MRLDAAIQPVAEKGWPDAEKDRARRHEGM